MQHIIFLQDKCAVFHVPKLDQKKAINHVMAWERKQRSDFSLPRSLSPTFFFLSPSLCSRAPTISSPLPLLPYLISPVKPPPFLFCVFYPPCPPFALVSSLFRTTILSHIVLPVATELFSHCCAGTTNYKNNNSKKGMCRFDEVPAISIASCLFFHPPCSEKQGLCATESKLGRVQDSGTAN